MALRHAVFFRTALAWAGVAWLVGQAAAADPAARLYDAPIRAVADPSAKTVAQRSGWQAVKEGDTTHRFGGCAALVNDKIAAVMRKGTPEIALYSLQTASRKLCARLWPVTVDGAMLKPTSLAVAENTTDGVALAVGLLSPTGKACRLTYRLGVGQPFLQATATAGVARLRVAAPCRFAVMPDFFGDDIVVDARAIPVGRAELPSENFLLHMMHQGEAIVMTVSESRDNDVGIALSGSASSRRIECSDITFGGKPHIWVAVLADKGIWHERTVAPAEADKILPLDWRMPFPALWRVDWRAADTLTDSWGMLLQHPQGKYVMQDWFGEDASSGQRFGPELGPRDWNKPGRKRWNPVLGSFAYPCWVDKDGRGHLQPLAKRRYVERGEVCPFDGPAILYPLDRAKVKPFETPPEKLTVVDVVRQTLGVGPCRYLLDLEGQKRNSQGVATCYARDVINAIYKDAAQLQKTAVIEKHLTEAVAFIRNVRERIDEYVAFGREMRRYLQEQKRLHVAHAKFLDEMLRITTRLDELFEAGKAGIQTPRHAAQNAADFRKELLDYIGKDAYKKCDARMRIFTGIGGRQDGLVASCRMIVKTLRQRSGIAMAVDPELKDIATEIRRRTRTILRNPTGYEAPQH